MKTPRFLLCKQILRRQQKPVGEIGLMPAVIVMYGDS